MARVYLQAEIVNILDAVEDKIESARATVNNTELAVQKSINANQTPIEANGVGVEGYQSAGILIAEAIAMLQTLNADASSGLVFPSIAKVGHPWHFDRVHFDAEDLSGSGGDANSFIIELYSHDRQYPLSGNDDPLASVFASGDEVKLINANNDVSAGDNLSGIEEWEGTILSVGTTGSPTRSVVKFEEQFNYQGTGHTVANAGGDGTEFEMRLIGR